MKYPPRWKRALVCCTCLGFLLLLHALAAPSFGGTQNLNLDRGFETARAYAVGEIDNVNLFNGNLVLTIPIGSTYYVGGNRTRGKCRAPAIYASRALSLPPRSASIVTTEAAT